MKSINIKVNLKNIIYTLAIPAAVFAIMELLVYVINGDHLISTVLDVRNLIRDTGISCIIAYALSFNLASGRFDLSLGAQRLVATIIGGNLAIQLGFNGIGLILMVILFGLIFGFIVGIVFVQTRVAPIVLGIGMALIYESIAFASHNEGLQLFGVPDMEILVDPKFTILVLAIATLLVVFLLGFTKFRYEMQAVRGSHRIARDSGINVFRHVVMCYTFAGGLVSVSGVLDTAFRGSMTPTLGMSSNTVVLASTFPMFLGLYMSKWSNSAVGILFATLTLKFFTLGLVALKISSSLSSTINMIVFIGFLIFLANQNIFSRRKEEKKRIQMAKQKRKEMAIGSPAFSG